MSRAELRRTLQLAGGEVGRMVPGALSGFPTEAMDRATGADETRGNRLQLQWEGSSTFDAWLDAIAGARRFVHFENYILRDDRVGRIFRDALVAKAREGVPVRLVYDWIGCWATPRKYWKPLREAGVEVRAFNRPGIRDPFGVFQRDHRKLVCVDGEVAFVGGFCVGVEWAGDGENPPWRDTGVEIRGPAAASAARAFGRIWDEIGEPLPEDFDPTPEEPRAGDEGDTSVWVIEGEPGKTRVYRTLQLVAAHARRRLWITDPYFVAPPSVSESLGEAARAGVDVRILLPAHNNWPWVGSLSRGGYRSLLKAGVRLFEWQGPMIHAKTSVCDGVWGRVGSSNLNAASLLGNWEIDAGILDEDLAAQLEGLFLADLASAVEIVLPGERVSMAEAEHPRQHPLDPEGSLPERVEQEIRRRSSGGSTQWGIAELVRAGTAFGDAIAGHRTLGREDRTLLGTVAVALVALAALAGFFPSAVGWIVAFVAGWFGLVVGVRGLAQARRAREEEDRVEKAIEQVDGTS